MKKINFEVPTEGMPEFVEDLSSRNLSNSVLGTNEDGDIIIEVFYDKEDEDEINQLENLLEKIIDELDFEDDE